MTRGISRHRNHNHGHHVGFTAALKSLSWTLGGGCQLPRPHLTNGENLHPQDHKARKNRGTGGEGGPRSSGLGVWASYPGYQPSTSTRGLGIGFSEQSFSFSPRGGGGGGGAVYKRQNQREQLEAEARKKPHRPTAFPGKGPLCGQRQSGSQPSIGQARTNQAGSPQRPRQPETPSAIHLSISSHPHGPRALTNLHSQQVPLRFFF